MRRLHWIFLPTCLACLVAPLGAQRVKLLVSLDSLVSRAQRDSMDAPTHYELALGAICSRPPAWAQFGSRTRSPGTFFSLVSTSKVATKSSAR